MIFIITFIVKGFLEKSTPVQLCSLFCCWQWAAGCPLGWSQFWKQSVHSHLAHPLSWPRCHLPCTARSSAAMWWPGQPPANLMASKFSAMGIFSICFSAGCKIGCTNRREMLIQFKQTEISLLLLTGDWLVCMNAFVTHLENIWWDSAFFKIFSC